MNRAWYLYKTASELIDTNSPHEATLQFQTQLAFPIYSVFNHHTPLYAM